MLFVCVKRDPSDTRTLVNNGKMRDKKDYAQVSLMILCIFVGIDG